MLWYNIPTSIIGDSNWEKKNVKIKNDKIYYITTHKNMYLIKYTNSNKIIPNENLNDLVSLTCKNTRIVYKSFYYLIKYEWLLLDFISSKTLVRF